MERKNSQIQLIENTLVDLHKVISEKEHRISQLSKDKEDLKENITSLKFEISSLTDDNEKHKKQIKHLHEKINELNDDLREKDFHLRAALKEKRNTEKLIHNKNESFLNSFEIKLEEAYAEIKDKNRHLHDLRRQNEQLQTLLQLANEDLEASQYDNKLLKKQIKGQKETIFTLEKQIKKKQNEELLGTASKIAYNNSDLVLDELEKHFAQTKKEIESTTKELQEANTKQKEDSSSEEDLIKSRLGL